MGKAVLSAEGFGWTLACACHIHRIPFARALLRQPRIFGFDEATANLDSKTAAHFARTINKLKGKATMLFIAHQLPRGLQVDEVVTLGGTGARMEVAGTAATGQEVRV